MYIPPFLAGVLFTVFAELAVIIFATTISIIRKKK